MNVKEMVGKKFTTIEQLPGAHGRKMSPEWVEAIGIPSIGFDMMVWGMSGNGKTTFVMKLCKELNRFGQVYYNSAEQGHSLSLQQVLKQCQMEECEHHPFMIGDMDSFEEMVEKLGKARQKTRFCVIDSVQHMGLTYEQYKWLKDKFKHIAFILISHATGGNEPQGAQAPKIRYKAEIKTNVRKGVAFSDSRFAATKPYRVMPWVGKEVDDDEPKPKRGKAKADAQQLELEVS
jgi:Ni2+-binding GTPase involved in maturation of urease and hydrogenase